MNYADFYVLLPALCVLGAGLLAVVVDTLFKVPRHLLALVSASGVIASAVLLVRHLASSSPAIEGFGGTLVLDHLSAFVSLGIVLATGLLVAVSSTDAHRRRIDFGEYYGLVLCAAAGMMLLVGSNDFLLVFLNLEIFSVALYVLTGITRRNPKSNEAAMKYLVTGAFATAFLLMGMALIYGATGSIRLDEIGLALRGTTRSPLLVSGVGFLLVGFGFKLGAVPFHMWVPDVYEGAPTTTTAFMAVTVKAAAIGVLARVLVVALGARPDLWGGALWWLSVVTMVVGNLLAARQTSVKRMLAYSGVAHTGYALMALAAMSGTDGGWSAAGAGAAVFYAFNYTFMTLGAFAFLSYMGHTAGSGEREEWQDGESIDDLAGLGARRPWAAFGMSVLLLSLGGLPPTAGFFGKFYVFTEVVAQGHVVLAVIGVLATLVSLYYYLGVISAMYLSDSVVDDEKPAPAFAAVMLLAVGATVVLGLRPSWFLLIAERSVQLLLG